MNDVWRWDFVWQIMPAILDGLIVTVEVTIVGSIIAYLLGLAFAMLRRSRIWLVRTIMWMIIEFIRSTPLLVQLFLLFALLPDLGITLSAFLTGIIGLGLHYACYTAEVYRAGIEAVPEGQWEAATALSLPASRTWFSVILPQAFRRVLPALGNYTISLLKEVPLLLAIGVLTMVSAAYEVGSSAFRYVEPITVAGVFFLVISYFSSLLVRFLERRLGVTAV